jgi:hypothetical protein
MYNRNHPTSLNKLNGTDNVDTAEIAQKAANHKGAIRHPNVSVNLSF